MYMCIFHYFNYYVPDFVTAICLGFIFGFLFLGICFNLTKCHNNLLVESSFLTRDQALSLWSGSTDSKTLDYRKLTLGGYQIVRTNTEETAGIQDPASHNHHPVQDASSKQQTNKQQQQKQTQSSAERTATSLSLAHQRINKQTKNSSQFSPIQSLYKPLDRT